MAKWMRVVSDRRKALAAVLALVLAVGFGGMVVRTARADGNDTYKIWFEGNNTTYLFPATGNAYSFDKGNYSMRTESQSSGSLVTLMKNLYPDYNRMTGTLSYAGSGGSADNSYKVVLTGPEADGAVVSGSYRMQGSNRDVSFSFTVHVKKNASISFAESAISVALGEAVSNELTNTGDGTVTFESSNASLVSVDATTGAVTVLGPTGETPVTITATVTPVEGGDLYADTTASYTVTVGKKASSISFEKAEVEGTVGGTAEANTLIDANDGDGTVAYSVADDSVGLVTVDQNGVVSILHSGTATIIATVTDSETYHYDPATAQYAVNCDAADAKLRYAVKTIEKTVGDPDFTNGLTDTGDALEGGFVRYESSDESVATVDGTGKVTIVGAGTTTITASLDWEAYGEGRGFYDYNYDGIDDEGQPWPEDSYELTVKEREPGPEPEPQEKATLRYDLAGGTLDGKTGSITVSTFVGETVTILDAPTRDGYTFEYWEGSEYYPGDEYFVTGDHDFVAVWSKDSGNNSNGGKKSSNTNGGNKTASVVQRLLPRTGDPTSLAAIAGLAFGGAASLAGGTVIRPRRKRYQPKHLAR